MARKKPMGRQTQLNSTNSTGFAIEKIRDLEDWFWYWFDCGTAFDAEPWDEKYEYPFVLKNLNIDEKYECCGIGQKKTDG